jgi:16S rRNA (uracil1498-N3)-methyltransferase
VDRVDSAETSPVAPRRLHYEGDLASERFVLTDAAAHHARVLRLAVGDPVELFDGKGRHVHARIAHWSAQRIECERASEVAFEPRGPAVILVQCVVKGRKMDDIVRMTSELGVSAIHLAVSERCVVQKTTRDEHKVERLARIASEAARQAEQAYVPEIVEAAELSRVLARAPESAARCALTERSRSGFALAQDVSELWLVVGPEGGLSSRDREILCHAKFAEMGLGRAILRSETAAVVGVGLGISALGRGR